MIFLDNVNTKSGVAFVDFDDDDNRIEDESVYDVRKLLRNGLRDREIIEILTLCGWDVSHRMSHTTYYHADFLVIHNKGNEIFIHNDFRAFFTTPFVIFSDLPDLFIGTEDDLLFTIYKICQLMKNAYNTRNISLPPWRQLKHVKDVYFGKSYKDKIYSSAFS